MSALCQWLEEKMDANGGNLSSVLKTKLMKPFKNVADSDWWKNTINQANLCMAADGLTAKIGSLQVVLAIACAGLAFFWMMKVHLVLWALTIGVVVIIGYLMRENQRIWELVDAKHKEARDREWIRLDAENMRGIAATFASAVVCAAFFNSTKTALIPTVGNALLSSLAMAAITCRKAPVLALNHVLAAVFAFAPLCFDIAHSR